MITLTPNGDGTYAEIQTDPDGFGGQDITLEVAWIRDGYTEPRDSLYDCDDCGEPIEEWELWTCLDGGEAAHLRCVTIERSYS